VGVYKRPESKYYWLYLETTKQKERTDILIGETAAQRKDARRLADETYQRRMLEIAEQKIRPLAGKVIRFSAYAETYARDVIPLRRGARRELEMLKPLRRFFDGDLVSKITADRVRAYMAARSATVQPRTFNREVDLLKGMLRDAVGTYLEASPIAGLKRVAPAPVKRRLLQPAEEQRLLKACEDPQDKALIVLGLDTMIRLGDLLDLERSDRDGDWLYVKHAKSGEAYETALSPRALAVLKAIEQTDARYYFAKFRRALEPRDWLSSVRQRFEWLCQEADVKYGRATGLTFHWATRRTGATRYLLEKGAPISAVQKQGNWKHPEMLLQIYAEARRDDQLAMVGARRKKA
jgi:integrase